VRLIDVQLGITIAWGSFTEIPVAVNAAAVLGAALQADGWFHLA